MSHKYKFYDCQNLVTDDPKRYSLPNGDFIQLKKKKVILIDFQVIRTDYITDNYGK